MRIFRNEPEKFQRADSTPPAAMIVYWLLRGFTFSIGVLLGINILASFVWIPFYAGEAYTPQFEDRIFGLIGDVLLFISIVIPHPWTLSWRRLLVRIAIMVLAVSWIVMVDVIAYKRGLSTMLFTPHGFIALLVATALLATLVIQFKRRRRTPASSGLAMSGLLR